MSEAVPSIMAQIWPWRSQIAVNKNQLTGFYLMGTLVVTGLTNKGRCQHHPGTFTDNLEQFMSLERRFC